MTREVRYVDFPAQFDSEHAPLMEIVERVFRDGIFVGGAAIGRLEEAVAAYCGVAHAVALNSGTDALILAMRALDIGPGDEVITPPNSFIASTGAIVALGATPVFVDVLPDQNIDPDLIEAAITERTKAIMPVHLTGRVAAMDRICDIAKQHDLYVVEDAAQAFGSRFNEALAGSIGDVGCFSAHPLKNLNAAGDGGMIVTDDADVAAKVRLYANHGLIDRETASCFGTVSRMDTLQAEILLFRLGGLAEIYEKRRANAELYRSYLDTSRVFVPACGDAEYNTFHTMVIQVDRRDDLKRALSDAGIGTAIHYPVPIHLQPAARVLGYGAGDFPQCERQAGQIISLPIHQYLEDADIRYVADTINEFLAQSAEVAQ